MKLTGSAVLYFSFFTERGGQPVTLEPSATPAFLLLRLPSYPAAGLGSDRPPWIWGEEHMYPACIAAREQPPWSG